MPSGVSFVFKGPLKGFPYAFLPGFCIEVSLLSVRRGVRLRLVSWKAGREGADFFHLECVVGPIQQGLGSTGFSYEGVTRWGWAGGFVYAIASAACEFLYP